MRRIREIRGYRPKQVYRIAESRWAKTAKVSISPDKCAQVIRLLQND